jgi:outer membrane protein OmpA-like peptidoglycan-associated protein
MSPFTPYSVKYVGYGIEKGKLSFNVKYKLENRKLEAQNQIILNQLTFGERVESPTATKLPVLLAVALLKDRNGVIDVNLPVSGSLDDPQFSVGGIVLRLVINMITRAVTAPFTLIASMFGSGGSGEELSFVEFDYGSAALSGAAEAKIKTLATAMNNRPALKLEISARVDPVNDMEGLRKLTLERKLKAQKLKELARRGAAPASVDEVQIGAEEYERYLKAAYGVETFPKPRNVIGLAKDLPRAEMEALMLKHIQLSDDDLRDLAQRRADTVRDRLFSTGQIGSDRVFMVAAKTGAADGKAKSSRVDFSLR